MEKETTITLGKKIIGAAIVVVFVAVIAYFFISAGTAKDEIPSYVTGEKRILYDWARSIEGKAILEQIPCYCGCKFEGHLHARHCFWKDDGSFDKHGITCSVCFDIARTAKQRHEQGIGICEIRNEIDTFYKPNAELSTPTPMPAECVA